MTVRNTFSGIARLKLVRSLIITIYYESLNYCSSTFPSHQRRVFFVVVDGFAPPTHGLAPAALLLSYTTPYIFWYMFSAIPAGWAWHRSPQFRRSCIIYLPCSGIDISSSCLNAVCYCGVSVPRSQRTLCRLHIFITSSFSISPSMIIWLILCKGYL